MLVAAAASLLGAGPALAASKSENLRFGMVGPAVRGLQVDLTKAGYRTTTTGVFDEPTQTHVVAFQRKYDLTANGVVGKPMFAKLREVAVVRMILASPSPETATTGAISPSGTVDQTTSSTTTTPTTTTTTTPTTTTPTTTTPGPDTGGIGFGAGPSSEPMMPARLMADGLAVPAPGSPQAIREAIAGADLIAFDPYIYGGGHQSFNSAGYDCSGSVSFALHAAGLLKTPMDSTQFETWGKPGKGRWITLWANGGHVYMEIAGLFFDTAAQTSANGSDRWSPVRISPKGGFIERHPTGW
jgi:cell wall-associated NlpC family hydrolase